MKDQGGGLPQASHNMNKRDPHKDFSPAKQTKLAKDSEAIENGN
jgi:hypothetical protein